MVGNVRSLIQSVWRVRRRGNLTPFHHKYVLGGKQRVLTRQVTHNCRQQYEQQAIGTANKLARKQQDRRPLNHGAYSTSSRL